MRTKETMGAIDGLLKARRDIAEHRNALIARRRNAMDAWDSTREGEERRDLSRTYGELYETTSALADTLKGIDAQLAILTKDVDA